MSGVERSLELSQRLMATTSALASDYKAEGRVGQGGFLETRLLTFNPSSANNYVFVLSALWEFSNSTGHLDSIVAIRQAYVSTRLEGRVFTVKSIFASATNPLIEGSFAHSLAKLQEQADPEQADLIDAFQQTVAFIETQI